MVGKSGAGPERCPGSNDDSGARAPWLYRGRQFLDHGITLVGSSDRPVTAGAPLRDQFMAQRLSESGQAIGAEEAVSVVETLRAYTANAAYACHREETAGSISPGKHADLVVLGGDPRRVDLSRISDVEVVATLVGGATAHGLDMVN